MLLQAYDFLHLFDAFGCRLQLGGSDQWGNITMGIDLVRKVRQQEVWGLTTPLVLKADGTKFGKTESGTVWLDPARTSPYQLYQFFLRSEDAVVGLLSAVLHLPRPRHDPRARRGHRLPAGATRGPAGAGPPGLHARPRRPPRRSGPSRRPPPCSARRSPCSTSGPCSTCSPRPPRPPWPGADWTARGRPWSTCWWRPAWSRRRAGPRTTVEQGGAYVNNRRETDPGRVIVPDDLMAGRYLVLRRGKRDYHLVKFD